MPACDGWAQLDFSSELQIGEAGLQNIALFIKKKSTRRNKFSCRSVLRPFKPPHRHGGKLESGKQSREVAERRPVLHVHPSTRDALLLANVEAPTTRQNRKDYSCFLSGVLGGSPSLTGYYSECSTFVLLCICILRQTPANVRVFTTSWKSAPPSFERIHHNWISRAARQRGQERGGWSRGRHCPVGTNVGRGTTQT